MSKQTFEQLMQAFNELMAELEKSKAASNKTPECDDNCHSCGCTTEGDDSEITMTPLERLISDRINKHLVDGTFPSLEEAQAIHILDSINYRYNR